MTDTGSTPEESEETLSTNRKSAKGAGTLRKRSDGRWEGRYSIGFDAKTGKQIQKSVHKYSVPKPKAPEEPITGLISKAFGLPKMKFWDYKKAILVQTIDTVLVCAKPCVGFAVCKNAADICGADYVLCTRLMSHITEA